MFWASFISVTDTVKPKLAIALSNAACSASAWSAALVSGVAVPVELGKLVSIEPPLGLELVIAMAWAAPVAATEIAAGIAAGYGKVAKAFIIPLAVFTATSTNPMAFTNFSFLPASALARTNPEFNSWALELATAFSVCILTLASAFSILVRSFSAASSAFSCSCLSLSSSAACAFISACSSALNCLLRVCNSVSSFLFAFNLACSFLINSANSLSSSTRSSWLDLDSAFSCTLASYFSLANLSSSANCSSVKRLASSKNAILSLSVNWSSCLAFNLFSAISTSNCAISDATSLSCFLKSIWVWLSVLALSKLSLNLSIKPLTVAKGSSKPVTALTLFWPNDTKPSSMSFVACCESLTAWSKSMAFPIIGTSAKAIFTSAAILLKKALIIWPDEVRIPTNPSQRLIRLFRIRVPKSTMACLGSLNASNIVLPKSLTKSVNTPHAADK